MANHYSRYISIYLTWGLINILGLPQANEYFAKISANQVGLIKAPLTHKKFYLWAMPSDLECFLHILFVSAGLLLLLLNISYLQKKLACYDLFPLNVSGKQAVLQKST